MLYCVEVWSLLGAKYDLSHTHIGLLEGFNSLLFLIGPNLQERGGGGEWVILLGTSEVK